MATSGFKQQCPSCEALVPIKDTSLVGRKIDCPKCKYRFVVEEPGEEKDASDDSSEDVKKSAKKKGGAPAAKTNGIATKKRLRGEEDPEEAQSDEAPRKKTK